MSIDMSGLSTSGLVEIRDASWCLIVKVTDPDGGQTWEASAEALVEAGVTPLCALAAPIETSERFAMSAER